MNNGDEWRYKEKVKYIYCRSYKCRWYTVQTAFIHQNTVSADKICWFSLFFGNKLKKTQQQTTNKSTVLNRREVKKEHGQTLWCTHAACRAMFATLQHSSVLCPKSCTLKTLQTSYLDCKIDRERPLLTTNGWFTSKMKFSLYVFFFGFFSFAQNKTLNKQAVHGLKLDFKCASANVQKLNGFLCVELNKTGLNSAAVGRGASWNGCCCLSTERREAKTMRWETDRDTRTLHVGD